jgi:phosphate transport system protein
MGLIATQQPVGKDLRVLGTCLKIVSDFDRLGDLAGNIIKIAKFDITDDDKRPSGDQLLQMTNLVDSMLVEVLESFEQKTPIPVEKIQKSEDEVDRLFRGIRDHLVSETCRDSSLARANMAYSFVARYLERCADHLSNVASRIYYMHTGERIKIE